MKVDLEETFGKRIKIDPKVRTISGVFFSKENLEQTDYRPAYQRNYVWDDEKASYFIESIFLGTEIPPLIYFKTEKDDEIKNEIIDGRQRYQSILRFINGELRLKKNGMPRLGDIEKLAGHTYHELSPAFRATFEDTKIRIIEFSFLFDHTSEEEDAVKKEIFQRYNSGITPLKNVEIDNAQYLHNELNSYFKEKLRKERNLDDALTRLFKFSKNSVDQKVMKIRELLVLHRIPIKYYATKKQTVIKKYFELLSNQITEDQIEDVYNNFVRKIHQIELMEKTLSDIGIAYNRLYSECFYWALSIVEEEKGKPISFDLISLSEFACYFKEKEEFFTTIRSSFAQVLFDRYKCTATFFEMVYDCKFTLYLYNNEGFKHSNQQVLIPAESYYSSLSLDELRINKPEPISEEVSEIIRMVQTGRFMIRPSYQRNEVSNRKKSSSIIESLLLGIKLPPIFVFKRSDGVKELIDGQQRLLSILGFMGEKYLDENEDEQYSNMNGFKLDLKENAILSGLNTLKYEDLTKSQKSKIRNSDLWIIEINQQYNKNFDPIDLFVRLNNKPYPIAKDSFEMWNSFASRSLIDTLKSACGHNLAWFYLRKNNNRMDNENLFTTLAYFQYAYLKSGIKTGEVAPEKTIEFYKVDKRITCRFNYRYDISKLMETDDHVEFVHAINCLEFGLISNLRTILHASVYSHSDLGKILDEILKFEIGRRTQMKFYLLWVLLHDLEPEKVDANADTIGREITTFVEMLQTCNDVDAYKQSILTFRGKYKSDFSKMLFHLGTVADVFGFKDGQEHIKVQMLIETTSNNESRFIVKPVYGYIKLDKHQFGINITRQGLIPRYIECILRSTYIANSNKHNKSSLGILRINQFEIPYVKLNMQNIFCNLSHYVDLATGLQKKYYERILDLMVYEIVYREVFSAAKVSVINIVKEFPVLPYSDVDDVISIVNKVYLEQSDPKSEMSILLLKAIDLKEIINS